MRTLPALLLIALAACGDKPADGSGDTDTHTPDDTDRDTLIVDSDVADTVVDSDVADTVVDSDVADTVVDSDVADTEIADTQVVDTQVADTQVVDTQVVDTQVIDTQVVDTQVIDTEVVDTQVVDTQVADTQVAVNHAPAISIDAPVDFAVVVAGTPVAFSATVSDVEDAARRLAVVWRSSLPGDDLSALPQRSTTAGVLRGNVTFPFGTRTITATVSDTAGASTADTVHLEVVAPPTCAFSLPLDAAVLPDPEVRIEALLADADTPVDQLTVSFASSVDGPLGEAAPALDGTAVLDAWLSVGTHTLTLTARDPDGAACTASRTVRVAAPPTLSVLSPVDGAVVSDRLALPLRATAGDADGVVAALDVTFTTVPGGLLWSGHPTADGSIVADLPALSPRGIHTWTLDAVDADGLHAVVTGSVRVNTPPTRPTVAVEPAAAHTGDALTAVFVAPSVDADGDALTYSYAWTRNGVLDGATGSSIAAGVVRRGEVWGVTVTPDDGWSKGPGGFASVTIGNTPPRLLTAAIQPVAPKGGDLLRIDATTSDVDGDVVEARVVWNVDGVPAGTAATYGPVRRGQVVYAVVTAWDGSDASSPLTTASVVVQNALPVVSGVSITPARPTPGDELRCVAASVVDADADVVTLAYTWTVDDVPLAYTTERLPPGAAGRTGSVRCTITPFDPVGPGATVTSGPVSLANGAPTITAASLTPSSPTAADTVQVVGVTVTDPEGDPTTWSVGWTVDGSPAGTGTKLVLSGYRKGQIVAATVTPNDPYGTGVPMVLTTTMVNASPTIGSLAITPAAPITGDLLTAVGTANDLDGDALTWTYVWTRNSVEVQRGPSATLSGSRRGDSVVLSATVTDGTATSPPVVTSRVIIGDAAASITTATLTPPNPTRSSTLSCAASGWFDLENDPPAYRYAWAVDGATILGATGATFSAASLPLGTPVTCIVTPDDGRVLGAPITSNSVLVSNERPHVTGLAFVPATPTVANVLALSFSVVDPDADPTTIAYAWTVDGAPAGTAATLDLHAWHRGQVVRVVVTPSDPSGPGTAAQAEVTIANAIPVVSAGGYAPSAPVTDDDIRAVPVGLDADGDALTWTFTWKVDGVVIQTGNDDTLKSYRGKSIEVTAVASDGVTSSAPFTFPAVVVADAPPSITSVTLAPAAPTVDDTLTCDAVGAFDREGDTVSFSYVWMADGNIRPSLTGPTAPAYAFSRGVAISCAITPFDGERAGAELTSAPVQRVNVGPTVLGAEFSPSAPIMTDTVVIGGIAVRDADGDTTTVRYAWTVAGAPAGTADRVDLSTRTVHPGDTVAVTVTPSDSYGDGTPRTFSVLVANRPPRFTGIAFTPDPPQVAKAVTASSTTADDDGDTVTVTYAWKVNGVAAGTGATLPAGSVTGHAAIHVDATATDSHGGVATTSLDRTVINTSPVVTNVTITPTPIYRASTTLTVAGTVTDADGDAVTKTYIWYVGGAEVYRSTSSASWTATRTLGQNISASISAADPSGATGSAVSAVYTVVNRPPVVPTRTVTGTPYPGNTVTCSGTAPSDPDGDPITTTYSFFVDGTRRSGPDTPNTWVIAANTQGGVLTCAASTTDTYDTTTSTSAGVTILNRAPTGGVVFESTPLYKNVPPTAQVTASDADGDTLTFTYVWTIDGVVAQTKTTSQASDTLTAARTYGDVITVTVTIADGHGGTLVLPTLTETVPANTIPTVSTFTLTAAPVYRSTTLTATCTGADVDQDTLAYVYTWSKNGTQVQAGNDGTFRGTTVPGDVIAVYCTISDGNGGTVTSSTLSRTVVNRNPTVAAISITPTTVYRNSTVAGSGGAVTDADGDSFTETWTWTKNSVTIQSGTAATLAPALVLALVPGDVLGLSKTAVDSWGGTTTVNAPTKTVANRTPTVTGFSITPAHPRDTENIVCTATVADGDDTPVTTVTWTKNGVAWGGPTTDGTLSGNTISAADTSPDDTWACVITATDPYGGTASANGSAVVPGDLLITSGNFQSLGTAGGTTERWYRYVQIDGTLNVGGTVKIHAEDIVISGFVDGRGRGYAVGGGYYPGGASATSSYVRVGGGGGGGGANGGKGQASGSTTRSTITAVAAMPTPAGYAGSGGGTGAFYSSSTGTSTAAGPGGAGGAGLQLFADAIDITGTIDLSAAVGTGNTSGGGGGGGGGGLRVQACFAYTGGGTLIANGGNGGNGSVTYNAGAGGGGGGGSVAIFATVPPATALLSTTLTGGAGGTSGTTSGTAGTTGPIYIAPALSSCSAY